MMGMRNLFPLLVVFEVLLVVLLVAVGAFELDVVAYNLVCTSETSMYLELIPPNMLALTVASPKSKRRTLEVVICFENFILNKLIY